MLLRSSTISSTISREAVTRFLRNLTLFLFHIGFVRPLMYFLGVRYRRRSLIPAGPCLVVSNHNSHLDTGVLMSAFPLARLPHVHPIAAADYFGKSLFKRTVAMLLMNGIPIERRPVPGVDPLAEVVEALNKGESLVFFPEGSRGEAGVVAPFRTGIGRLVKRVPGLLVVPVFMSGPERIWPRGQMIPVPLSVDVHVGKPRSYSPDEMPGKIAEQVRADVLAQAPPAPPVPGPRPARPVRVAVCGIDPGFRRDTFLEITGRLGALGRTIGIAKPFLEADEKGLRDMSGRLSLARSRTWIAFLAWLLRTGGLYKGFRFAEMIHRARIDEALDHGREAPFVVGDGNALVDLLAWAEADFYSGRFDEREMREILLYLTGERRIPFDRWLRYIRRAPEVWLLNILDLARPPLPDILVHVKLRPSTAMARVRSSGKALRQYETETFLREMQDAYGRVAGTLRRRRKLEYLDLNVEEVPPSQIADRVEESCARLADRHNPVPTAAT